MSKDVAVFKNAGLPVGNLLQFQQQIAKAQTNIAVKGGEDFLKLDKRDGEWRYGASETDVQQGSRWAINPASLSTGFIAWGKGEVLGKRMLPILTGQEVDQATLPNVGAKWDQSVSFQLRCLNGEDEGVQVLYEQNSYGGKKAFAGILQALQVQIAQDQINIVPVVVLKSDSYEHKQYGLTYNPIFEIVDWISMDGTAAPAAEESSDEPQGEVQAASEPAPPAKPAAKPKRAPVGGAAAVAAVETATDATKPVVTRQRRRPVAS